MNRPRFWLTHWRWLVAIAVLLLLINLSTELRKLDQKEAPGTSQGR